jgi:thiamine-monophosphate kinase
MPATPTERTLLSALRTRLQRQAAASAAGRGSVRVGIGDDCAVLRVPPNRELLITTDISLETIHFRRDWHTPESVGHRCLARGLSDLAAMGATPLAAFLSLALPPELLATHPSNHSWHTRFLDGLLSLAYKSGVVLAGGDTAQSPADKGIQIGNIPTGNFRSRHHGPTGLLLADIILAGTAPRGRALLRSTAKPGDRIYVTGNLGGSAAELMLLAENPQRFARLRSAESHTQHNAAPGTHATAHPHLFPQPRLAVGQALLARRLASSAIDISDGLSTDLDHLCEESGVHAEIEAARLPLHPLALAMPNAQHPKLPLHLALHGGEDYELLFTAAAETRVPRRIAGVTITCIGRILAAPRRTGPPRVWVLPPGAKRSLPLQAAGWEHFRPKPR